MNQKKNGLKFILEKRILSRQQQNCFYKNDICILKTFLTVIARQRFVNSRFGKQKLILIS